MSSQKISFRIDAVKQTIKLRHISEIQIGVIIGKTTPTCLRLQGILNRGIRTVIPHPQTFLILVRLL